MDVNPEALSAALKMAGQDTADIDKTLRLVRTVEHIRRDGATPDGLISLLAQYDPRYAAMAALARALGAVPTAASAEPSRPDVQYNHF